MVRKFTYDARRILTFAEEQARRFNDEYVGSEHLLMGLWKDMGGDDWLIGEKRYRSAPGNILSNLGLGFPEAFIPQLFSRKVETASKNRLPIPHTPKYTAEVRETFKKACKCARELGHDYVGAEHVLLGLLDLKTGFASEILAKEGVIGLITEETLDFMGVDDETHARYIEYRK